MPGPRTNLAVMLMSFAFLVAPAQGPEPASPAPDARQALRQQSEPPPAQTASEQPEVLRVTSRMVLVDAVVTDGSGKPVPGLKAADFTVLENGKPQSVRAFGARSPEIQARQTTAGSLSPHNLPAGLFTNITDFHSEYGPLVVILIDSLNTPPLDQVAMRDALIKYLRDMGPRQNVAIFTLGLRLGLIQNLNADPQLLQEALRRIASDPSLKKRRSAPPAPESPDARAQMLAADLLGAGATYDRDRQISMMQNSVIEAFPDEAPIRLDARVRLTLQALQKIGRNVAGYPGRKNLIWLSAGFPLSVDPISAGLTAEARNYQLDVQETANLLTNNEVAIYPVDVRGLVGSFMPDAASDIQRHGSFPGPAAGNVIRAGSLALGKVHNTMDHLAEQTGGRAFYNRNDIDHGIATSVQDGSTYYSLGYYPTDRNWDGKFRRIELRVTGKGLRVHYRRGYFANDTSRLTPEQSSEGRQEFLASMALDAPPATLLPVVAHVVAPDKEHPQLAIDIGVDPHSVIFEPQPNNRQQGEVEFATIVIDANGKPLTSKSDILRTELTPETFANVMKNTLVVRQRFDLQPGKYLLRVGVRDLKSNAMGTLIARAEILGNN